MKQNFTANREAQPQYNIIKTLGCCKIDLKVSVSPVRKVAEWLIPGIVLAVLPKCPLCIVAYVAAATGFGLSFSTAANIRILTLVLCLTVLAYLTAEYLYRLIAALVRIGNIQH